MKKILLLMVGLGLLARCGNAQNQAFSWAVAAGSGMGDPQGNASATDSAGNVYVAGVFSGFVDLGGGNLLVSGGGTDVFLAKYDAVGALQWARRAGSPGGDAAAGIAVADDGVFLTGSFSGTANFNTPADGSSHALSSDGGTDIFVAKWSLTGDILWEKRAGSTGADDGLCIATMDGAVFVAGKFRDTANFNTPSDGSSHALVSDGGADVFVAKWSAVGDILWEKRAGGTGGDQANGIATASGAVFVAGNFSGTANFNTPSSGSSHTLNSSGTADVFVAKWSAAGNILWEKRAGSTSGESAFGIAAADSSVYVTGYFNGTANFNTPSSGSSHTVVSAGMSDVFVAKWSQNGAILWEKRAGGTSGDGGHGIAVVGDAVFVTGDFEGAANFNTPATGSSHALASAGLSDVFVAKWSASGNILWEKRGGGTNDDDDGLGLSATGDAVFATGYFSGTANFNTPSSGGSNALVAPFQRDIFVAKWSLGGDIQWAANPGVKTGLDDVAYATATDDSGNVYMTGSFTGYALFGNAQLVSNGSRDVFVAKYDASGALQWARRAGGTSSDEPRGIAVADGAVYVVGTFNGTADFNTPTSGASHTLASAGSWDVFVAKWSDAGDILWEKRAGGTGNDKGFGIAVAGGSVYATGYFAGTANFNTPAAGGSHELVSAGGADVFVAKWSVAGNIQWEKRAGGAGGDEGRAIVLSGGAVYVAGAFSGTANFNTPSSGGSHALVSAGSTDVFVAKWSSSGSIQWEKGGGGTGDDAAQGIAAASNGIYVAGYFSGTADFGSGFSLVSAGGHDVFWAKWSTTGTVQQARRGGGTGFDEGYGVAVLGDAVFVAGYFQATANFNTPSSGSSHALVSAGSSDIFLAKWSVGGPIQWETRAGGAAGDFGFGVAASGSAIYLSGQFYETADFQTLGAPVSLAALGGNDIFLAKYDCAPVNWYLDADGDSYGNPASVQSACAAPPGYVWSSTDCDDGAANIHPNAPDDTCNGVDEDCDGTADDGAKPIALTFTLTKPNCAGGTGTLRVNPPGPEAQFSYLWNTGATTRALVGIPTGNYTATVTRISAGCTASAVGTLTEPTPLAVSLQAIQVKCFGESTGKITALASGGTGIKTYGWNTGANTASLTGVPAGAYTVTATDSKGCTISAGGIVAEPAVLTLAHVFAPTGSTFSATLTASGGTPFSPPNLYRYCKESASGGCSFGASNVFVNLLPNTAYTFRAKDAKGCTASLAVVTPSLVANAEAGKSALDGTASLVSISPNPFDNQLVIRANAAPAKQWQLQVFDLHGRLETTFDWPAGQPSLGINTFGWEPGIHVLQVAEPGGTVWTVLRAVKM